MAQEVPLQKLRPHPMHELLPPLTPAEFGNLKAEIAERGIQDALHVTPEHVILCGYHRYLVAKELGLTKVPVEVKPGLDANQQLVHLVHDNTHRRHLSVSQRALLAADPIVRKAVEEAAKKRQRAGTKLVALAPQGGKARDEVGRQHKVSGKSVDAAKLVLEPAPEKARAILAGTSNETVTQVAYEIRRIEKAKTAKAAQKNPTDQFPAGLTQQVFNVWNFNGLDPGYGKPHPGNIPASLVANALWYFTKPGDLVVDPMAGGGVVGDVCKAMGRRYALGDLRPTRPDVTRFDVTKGVLLSKEKADLVFVDPPYFTQGDRIWRHLEVLGGLPTFPRTARGYLPQPDEARRRTSRCVDGRLPDQGYA